MSRDYRLREIQDVGTSIADSVFEPLALSTDPADFEMAVDGTTDKLFQYIVPAEKNFHWYRTNWKILATSLIDLSLWDAAGRLSAADSPYIRVVNASDAEQIVFGVKTKVPFRGIAEMGLLAGVDLSVKTGSGVDVANIRWSLNLGLGQPLIVPAGYKIQWVVRGNMSALTSITAMVQGHLHEA